MGRHKTPDKTKELRGTDRNDRSSSSAPKFTKLADIPEAPSHFDDKGVAIWEGCCAELIANKLLSITDIFLLEVLIDAIRQFQIASEKISKNGSPVVFGVNKKPTINPWVKLKKQSADTIQSIVSQFGFSPLTRLKLVSEPVGNGGGKDALSFFLNGNTEDIESK